MSSLIEQAAKRLALLRQAGAAIPGEGDEEAVAQSEPVRRQEPSLVEMAERMERTQRVPVAAASTERTGAVVQPVPQSKRVELDLDAIAASGIVSPHAPRSQIADEYRIIKRPLIANAMGKGAAPIANANSIMVTSALPGEGKSFTAINLAMSIAGELDNTVMLVDADVAHPSMLKILGLPPAPGLLDVLQDESLDLSEVLLRTNVEKLTLLPGGTQHPRATELLASAAMANLVENMTKRYADRIIIFDSPPLLPTTESRALASHMGQIVVVVQAERTVQSDVENALATIEHCPVKLLVLNQARSISNNTYGYGYGYGYGNST